MYLEPSRTSKTEVFCERYLVVNCFRERTSSQKLDWFLNSSLILFSNVFWNAYRPIAKTKIFRLGVSLIRPLYVKKKEWIEKKITLKQNKIYYLNIKFTFIVYEYLSNYPI